MIAPRTRQTLSRSLTRLLLPLLPLLWTAPQRFQPWQRPLLHLLLHKSPSCNGEQKAICCRYPFCNKFTELVRSLIPFFYSPLKLNTQSPSLYIYYSLDSGSQSPDTLLCIRRAKSFTKSQDLRFGPPCMTHHPHEDVYYSYP